MAGKCPACGSTVSNLNGVANSIKIGRTLWKGVMFLCPKIGCHAVLGAQIDPIAIKSEIIEEITNELKKRIR